MRRSKAPSVLNKTNCASDSFNSGESAHCSEPEDAQCDWGSRKRKPPKNKQANRIFKVVWREVTTRKHKIWKGDGTLEVESFPTRVVLKDETGKYLGCSAKVDINGLAPDSQIVISGKEIEIQNEILDEEELYNVRKMQIENWVKEECVIEEGKKPKGGFNFKPILNLNSPKPIYSVERREAKENTDFESRAKGVGSPLTTGRCKEFICFLRPSELQQVLFKKVLECVPLIGVDNIEYVLKLICNHPSLINHKATKNELLRHLLPSLPDWTEMGPFDSGKLEFVQHFLTCLKKSNQKACIILAKSANVLNMLQGLCGFMKIKCFRLDTTVVENIEAPVLNFSSFHVILTSSSELLSCLNIPDFCNKILVFERYLDNFNVHFEKFKDLTIYNIVLAYSIEELLLVKSKNENVSNLLYDLTIMLNEDYDCCYLHSKIECNCFERSNDNFKSENIFIKNWKHFKTPFDLQLLKVSSLENSSENIVSIFYKKCIIT